MTTRRTMRTTRQNMWQTTRQNMWQNMWQSTQTTRRKNTGHGKVQARCRAKAVLTVMPKAKGKAHRSQEHS